ncbi:hypothetical protein L6R52_34530 [Myxococcota bacterium]|nr:hypothetical protein [Myxococcota bacterium]
MRSLLCAAVLAALAAGVGCIRVAGSVAQPTALERQLLGEYERLDDDLVHASSIRGPGGAASYDVLRAEALGQRAIQRYNEDDLLELKREKCLAETMQATIVDRPCAAAERDEAVRRRVARIVAEENRARAAIITWAAHDLARKAGKSAPTSGELDEVRRTYQRLLREAALPGQLAEVEPGTFREVAK